MSDSLRDQLLGLGFKPVPKPEPRKDERKPQRRPEQKPEHRRPQSQAGRPDKQGKPQARKPHAGQGRPGSRTSPQHAPPRTREDIDLAKAYAIRAQREKDERIEAERVKQEEARLRREAKAKLAELLVGKALNDPTAEIARHFDYGGKIKRIHVNAEQLKALNAGDLGVVQLDGRYLLVTADVLAQAEATFPPAVALKVDPTAPSGDDPYADPLYQVPDDLVW
jgi:uncharacterized protein YaiL (DUF2058 family)